jgi:hypothetical protein
VESSRAWIVAAAAGWALAIFAVGVLVGGAIDEDPATSPSRSPAVGGSSGAERETSQAVDSARAAPLRVALRDVKGELAIGAAARRGAHESRRASPAGGLAGGRALARQPGDGSPGAGPASSPAPVSYPAPPSARGHAPAGGRRVQRRGANRRGDGHRGHRRRARRRGRSPAPPAAPVAPFLPPPVDPDRGREDGHRGHGHGHDDDGHQGNGHDDDEDDDEDDDD